MKNPVTYQIVQVGRSKNYVVKRCSDGETVFVPELYHSQTPNKQCRAWIAAKRKSS